MSEKAKAAAKQFLSVLTPLFAEADRPLIEEKLGGNEQALIKLGEGVLRQEEFSSKMAEASQLDLKAKTWHANLDKWHVDIRNSLKEAGFDGADLTAILAAVKTKMAALKSAPAGASGGGDDPMELTEARVAQIVADAVSKVAAPPAQVDYTPRINEAMALAAALPKIAVAHLKKYGKELDTEALVEHARKSGKPIDQGGYEDFIKDDIAAFSKAAHDKEIAEAEARGAAKARAGLSSAPPWPTSGGEGNPAAEGERTTLTGLTFKDKDGKTPAPKSNSDGVAAAVETYSKLIAARGGAPS